VQRPFWATPRTFELRRSSVSYAPPLNYTSAVGATLRLELQCTLLSYLTFFPTTPHSFELRLILLWASSHSFELRLTLQRYAELFLAILKHPSEPRSTLLSYSIAYNLTIFWLLHFFTVFLVYPRIVRLQYNNCSVACYKVVFIIHLTALLIPNMHFRLASNAIDLLCIVHCTFYGESGLKGPNLSMLKQYCITCVQTLPITAEMLMLFKQQKTPGTIYYLQITTNFLL